ncbi:MAG: sulfatase-like hydrolase/transferase [Labilithrix sp.]|nr:sulfatase-like hydrolase/transferase [Labilithrix sp.]MCW5815406.1 sulfatase-like hydrolase/transferase [Labilithrix sp.]
MSRRFLDAIAPDLGGILAATLVLGGAFAIWAATAHLKGAPTDLEGLEAHEDGDGDGGAGEPESRVETTAADAGTTVSAPRVQRSYNVILVSVDTLRADLGFSGYPRPVSPNIDALAAKSVVFERTYALASFTPKCLGPMMIGRYSSEIYRDYEHYTKFGADNVFLAERIHDNGGRSAAAMCHRYFGWKKGLDQGFDLWDTSSIPPNSVDNDPTPTSEKLTDTAIGILSSQNGADLPLKDGKPVGADDKHTGRFFTWVHYLDPHLPYVTHKDAPSFASMGGAGIPTLRNTYDVEVWFTDKHIGRLFAHIAAQPWAPETAIILTADHGEAFGEKGHYGHGRELWEPLVRVPLIVYIPGGTPRRIETRRSHIDIVPTVLDLMGMATDDPLLHGKSLLKDIANTGPLEDHDIFIDMPDGPYNDLRRAVIFGPGAGFKMIEFQGNRPSELYDLANDPKESKNLASDAAKLKEAKEAMARVRATIKELPPQR